MGHHQPVLRARKLHKTFYRPARVDLLKGVDLDLFPGEAVAVTGRSGEGKSTLLQVLGTLEDPCSGILEICGEPVTWRNRTRLRNQRLAFIFQSFHLIDDCTALENVLMPARIARQNVSVGSAAYQRALELLDHVGLLPRAHFLVKLLSGGEKQRTAVARAFYHDPDLILADEPSGNLDEQTANAIHKLLLDFAHKKNKSVIVVTHDHALASMCDKEYVLHQGVLQGVQPAP